MGAIAAGKAILADDSAEIVAGETKIVALDRNITCRVSSLVAEGQRPSVLQPRVAATLGSADKNSVNPNGVASGLHAG